MNQETSTQRTDRHSLAALYVVILAVPISGMGLISGMVLEMAGYEQLSSPVLLSITVGLFALTYIQAYRGELE